MSVDVVLLSDLITEPVDYLKVDIEGSEFGVLKDLCATGKMGSVNFVRIARQSGCARPGGGTVVGAFASGFPHHG